MFEETIKQKYKKLIDKQVWIDKQKMEQTKQNKKRAKAKVKKASSNNSETSESIEAWQIYPQGSANGLL